MVTLARRKLEQRLRDYHRRQVQVRNLAHLDLHQAYGEAAPAVIPSPTEQAHRKAVEQARRDWQRQEKLTVQQMQQAYQQAIQDYRISVMSGPMGPVTAARREQLLDELTVYESMLTEQHLASLRAGVSSAYYTGLGTAGQHYDYLYTGGMLPGFGDEAAIQAVAQSYAEYEVATYLARTNESGLTLSDAVWRATDPFQQDVTRLVTQAHVTGMSAKDLATQIDLLDPLNPKNRTPSSQRVRRDLGISKDVSYASTRLARTEINTAGREGSVAAHSLSPFIEQFEWNRSPNRRYPCEWCDNLVEGGPYTSESLPVSHPNCRCYVTARVPDREEVIKDIAAWENDPTSQPEIEQWFQKLTGAPSPTPTPGGPPAPPPPGTGGTPIPGGALPTPQTPPRFQVPPWKEAKTVKEATAYAESLPGVKRANYGRYDRKIANIVNHDMAEMAEQGITLPANIEVEPSYRGDPNAIAAYGTYSDTMYLYRKHPWWKDPVRHATSAGSWFTSHSPNHVVRHELGHKAHADFSPGQYKVLSRKWTPQQSAAAGKWNILQLKDDLEKQVSGYGSTGPFEMVAEMYAGALDGKTYPPEVVKLYESLGAPPLPSPIGP